MVGPRRPLLRAFARSDRGAVLVEGLLALPVFLLACAVIIELSVGVIQFNQTVKALQIGSRQLAVSDPLAVNFTTALQAGQTNLSAGDPVPAAVVTSVCTGSAPANCNAARFNRLVYGSPTRLVCSSSDIPDEEVIGMCDIMPQIRPANVRVTYSRTGLGYVGRPTGPLPTITVEVVDLRFNFFILDALLQVASLGGTTGVPTGINIPASPVTITGEDLCSAPPDPITGRCPP